MAKCLLLKRFRMERPPSMGYPRGSAHDPVAPQPYRSGKKDGRLGVPAGGHSPVGSVGGGGPRSKWDGLLRRGFLRARTSRTPEGRAGSARSAGLRRNIDRL